MQVYNFKAGYYEPQGGYRCFIPNSINHEWILADAELESALADANRMLGSLNAYAQLVPSVDKFLDLYIAKEATTSSKIEGTRTEIDEIFLPSSAISAEQHADWQEVKNYIDALAHAMSQLEQLPLSSRIIRSTHRILIDGVRGKNKQPGEFRRSQNWIGGATIKQARFIPPPANAVADLISDIEYFIHNKAIRVPELIKIGIVHYQFETIHPFLDGNGRTGRLLISLQLLEAGYLKYPVLYLSDYIERNRSEYYERLDKVRTENDLRSWLLYFLRGIKEVSRESADTMQAIIHLREEVQGYIASFGKLQKNATTL